MTSIVRMDENNTLGFAVRANPLAPFTRRPVQVSGTGGGRIVRKGGNAATTKVFGPLQRFESCAVPIGLETALQGGFIPNRKAG
jgi:hypothetical protein